MRKFYCVWVLALLASPGVTPSISHAADEPNVLFIAIDDLNHWVTHLGRNPQAKTPNIDRLAKMGVTFTHAYCAVPACEPSRCALMGGRRPWNTGCYHNGDVWKKYQKPGEGLSAQFLNAGYQVAGAGKIYHSMQYYPSEWTDYMSKDGLNNNGGPEVGKMDGFHDPMTHDLKDDDLLDYHAVDYCIEQMNAETEKPFFVACGLYKPHLPFAVPRKYYDLFPLESIELPPYQADDLDDIPPSGVKMAGPNSDHAKFLKSGRWKAAIQSYLASCAYTDMNVGRLLDAIDASPKKDNTIIVLWGDHGWSFGEKKHWRKFALWEEPTRMPLIWVVPGMTKPGSVCTRTVDLMCVYPTLCDLAGIPRPAHVEGKSITALLADPNASWDLPAITTHGYENHSVRTESWRYIRYASGEEELYNEKVDPYEWTNVEAKPEHAAIKERLAKWLPTDPVRGSKGK
jgi:arylsulfatase A-like enzyme